MAEAAAGSAETQAAGAAARRTLLRDRARWMFTQRSRLVAFLVLGSLVFALGMSAWATGFRSAFWPNFLLNSSGDLIGGMIVLFLIEPIVRQAAALQIRQHPRLDYAWFLRRASAARVQIRILDTFSSLFVFDRDTAIRTLRDAAIQGTDIRVLLMSPNTDASTLRQSQLRHALPGLWINDRIQGNIADFQQLEAAILGVGNGIPHGTLELRLYTVAAPFALYGWDDNALFAFLPPHGLSDQSTQLEITAQSQLGREALDQFEAIWTDAAPVPQLLPIQVQDEQATRDLLVRFVHLDGSTYLISKRIDAAVQANPALKIKFGDLGAATVFEPEATAHDNAALPLLEQAFYAKYARRPDASYHLLRPRSQKAAPTDRPTEHDSLPSRTVMDLIAASQRSIRILDTSSTLMLEAGPLFARTAEQAMRRGVKVQVLLLAPTTRAAQDRATEIQDPAFETRIEENIRELRRLAHKMDTDGVPADRLEVRLYDRLPECSVHHVDDRMMVAFLPYQRRTSKVKHLEIGVDASLGRFADLQFQTKWGTARPLEGMLYADLSTGPESRRLLLRIWDVDGTRYLASNRIEELLPQVGTQTRPVRLTVEDRLGEQFSLSEPIAGGEAESDAAGGAFRAVYGSETDAPIRRLDPVQGAAAAGTDA